MPKLPRISAKELIKILEKRGFFKVRQKGSHVVLKKKSVNEDFGCVIPLHKELAIGTLRNILKKARLDPDDLYKY